MSDILTEVGSATINPFVNLWHTFLNHIPGFIGAIVVVIIGYIVAYFIGHLIKHALQKARLDKWILKNNLSKTVLNIKLSVLAGQLIKWGIFISFLVPAAELIKIAGFTTLIHAFAMWVPKLILAVIVLTFGVILAKIVAREIHNKGNRTSQIISKVVQISLIVIFFQVAFSQIGVSTDLIERIILLVIGTVLLISAIVFGISFGSAGKKYAEKIVDHHMKKKK